ncbi:hypothetical protein EUX98_g4902 [Antrodiella citrinella]|uniref:Dipeptidyl aminopeptidase n=1 Tax=Antrodiella citrinella TaxID=2447956 RepID=A0A4S4MT19_9APHY|nr:hypothetical protein EUX98_g4902 [Antrodiella citrinella]
MHPAEYSTVPQDRDDVFSPSVEGALKPEAYYGEGPFDPPSSDDEDETLLEKDIRRGAIADVEETGLRVGGGSKRSSVRCLVICLSALVTIAAIIGLFAAFSYTGTSYRIRGTKHITIDHVFNGTFGSSKRSLRWVPEAGDGVFATTNDGFITLVDLQSNTSTNLVSVNDIKDMEGNTIALSTWELSSDMKYMLIKADYTKARFQYSFGNYYIHDLTTQATYPLIPPSHPPTTVVAKWSPTGQSVAFVNSNDLYILPSPAPSTTPIRVTHTGNTSVFNGVTDWVYEEEVYSGPLALWWSPNSEKVAFLSFDETAVDEFTYPVYNPTDDSHTVVPYPDHVTMKYPKPGYNNPLVSVHIFEVDRYNSDLTTQPNANATVVVEQSTVDLDWEGRYPLDNSVIAEVAWVGNTTLLVKEVTRAAHNGSVVLFDLQTGATNIGTVVRKLGKLGEQGDDGWIDSAQAVYPLPSNALVFSDSGYLDIVPSKDGYNHVALFSPANNATPHFLTSGEWEVSGTILGVNSKLNEVYFEAANPSSVERNIFSISLPSTASSEAGPLKSLTDISTPSSYGADFSPQAGFYVLSYNGPSVPWQNILRTDNSSFKYVLTENARLNDTLAQFEMPTIIRGTIESDGYELNYREIRPPRMDDSGKTKYPVLFQVYGGPGAQLVNMNYNIDWHYTLACVQKYIVVIVDGRGTGFKGRKLRNPVKNNLGHWETIDQINAAKSWAAKEYIDKKRIGIWGWSYGGFMSSKVVEADAGVHTLAMAVAPVTSWKLYDTIYTERYMDLPQLNPDGYVTASISNVTAFHNFNYLLAHGSGDDNVHFANSAHLLDMFTQEKVRGFRFRMFTDSDHSITRRGGQAEVYQFLNDFLVEKNPKMLNEMHNNVVRRAQHRRLPAHAKKLFARFSPTATWADTLTPPVPTDTSLPTQPAQPPPSQQPTTSQPASSPPPATQSPAAPASQSPSPANPPATSQPSDPNAAQSTSSSTPASTSSSTTPSTSITSSTPTPTPTPVTDPNAAQTPTPQAPATSAVLPTAVPETSAGILGNNVASPAISASPSATSAAASASGGVSTPVVVGGVVAALVGVAGIIFAVMYFLRRQSHDDDEPEDFHPDTFRRQSILLPDTNGNPPIRSMTMRQQNDTQDYPASFAQRSQPYSRATAQDSPMSPQFSNGAYYGYDAQQQQQPSFSPGQFVPAGQPPMLNMNNLPPAAGNPFYSPIGESSMTPNTAPPDTARGEQTMLMRQSSTAVASQYVTRLTTPRPGEVMTPDGEYVDLSRSSVTPYQAAQYAEISRRLNTAPLPMPTPVLATVAESMANEVPMPKTVNMPPLDVGQNVSVEHCASRPANNENSLPESPFADPEYTHMSAVDPDEENKGMPQPPSQAYSSNSRVTSSPPVLPDIHVHQRAFSPVQYEGSNLMAAPSQFASSPLAQNVSLPVAPPSAHYAEHHGMFADVPKTPTANSPPVTPRPHVPEAKRPETFYDDDDAYAGI